jgi:hypothetical protein
MNAPIDEPPEVIERWTAMTMHRLWKLRVSRYLWVKIRTKSGFYMYVNKHRPAFKRAIRKERMARTRAYKQTVRDRKEQERKFWVQKNKPRTKRGRDAAVARHRAETAARSPGTKRTISEVIASLTPEERAAISANEHAVEAVSKIIEAMLFRFSQ